jgi:branched-chain amino acid aminotransferase
MSVSNAHDKALPCWVDGRTLPRHEALTRIDDSTATEGRGHYTTALVSGGEVRWIERHVRRLRSDAPRLGLPEVSASLVRTAFRELAPAAFGSGDGAIRLQHSVDGSGCAHLVGIPRSLGEEPDAWSTVRAPLTHEGARPWSGIKISSQLLYAMGRDAAKRAGAQDALYADSAGRLIEGGRCNLFVARASGEWVTPDLARGGVSGLGREVVLEAARAAAGSGTATIAIRDIGFHELASAAEIVAVNSLRGARAVVRLDGNDVGCENGPMHQQLADWIGIE